VKSVSSWNISNTLNASVQSKLMRFLKPSLPRSGSLKLSRREFQSDRPATEMARVPSLLSRHRGTTKRRRVADRRCCRAETSVHRDIRGNAATGPGTLVSNSRRRTEGQTPESNLVHFNLWCIWFIRKFFVVYSSLCLPIVKDALLFFYDTQRRPCIIKSVGETHKKKTDE